MQSNVILCPFAPPTVEDSALRVNVFVPSDNQGSFRALAAALPITSTVATLLATLNDATAANVTAEATHRLTAISAIANVVGSDAPAAFLGDDFALADLYSATNVTLNVIMRIDAIERSDFAAQPASPVRSSPGPPNVPPLEVTLLPKDQLVLGSCHYCKKRKMCVPCPAKPHRHRFCKHCIVKHLIGLWPKCAQSCPRCQKICTCLRCSGKRQRPYKPRKGQSDM